MNLTSNPDTEKLTKTTVRGRTVYVSERNKTAFVETDEGLVSMTNVSAWNHLIEQAKIQEIEGYDEEKTVKEKNLEKDYEAVADKNRDLRRELQREESKFRSRASSRKDGDKE